MFILDVPEYRSHSTRLCLGQRDYASISNIAIDCEALSGNRSALITNAIENAQVPAYGYTIMY